MEGGEGTVKCPNSARFRQLKRKTSSSWGLPSGLRACESLVQGAKNYPCFVRRTWSRDQNRPIFEGLFREIHILCVLTSWPGAALRQPWTRRRCPPLRRMANENRPARRRYCRRQPLLMDCGPLCVRGEADDFSSHEHCQLGGGFVSIGDYRLPGRGGLGEEGGVCALASRLQSVRFGNSLAS